MLVYSGAPILMKKNHEIRKKIMKMASSPRASVTFPPDIYQTLEQIAKQKKVSIAWVVRDAAEKYVAEKWPLFQENS
jgi:metal-responsive CopG/Arc/MetJ family transcriptional regulator